MGITIPGLRKRTKKSKTTNGNYLVRAMDMMTTAIINTISRMFYLLLTLLFSSSIFSSCSKDRYVDYSQTSKLSIAVAGVVETKDSYVLSKAVNGGRGGLSSNANNNDLSFAVDEFTVEINSQTTSDTEQINPSHRLSSTPNSPSINGNSRAAVVGMENDVKYRILLFNLSTKKFERSEIATAGTLLEIDVYKGQEYEWYAYSYNTADHIIAPDINNPQVESKTDRPLLYANGTVTANDIGATPININFQHQLAQIKVEVDTRAVYGDI